MFGDCQPALAMLSSREEGRNGSICFTCTHDRKYIPLCREHAAASLQSCGAKLQEMRYVASVICL